ncbi:unnamed protein product [Ambrosiozyma monospora]|uniref:Unnamed protein product n=1 Tax=Ambrosiozyma monospora TaxID=43982 RepID=A0A9W7DHY2_AMBMO|nr:unnamed protein product [Ambrosiozyma monospora]
MFSPIKVVSKPSNSKQLKQPDIQVSFQLEYPSQQQKFFTANDNKVKGILHLKFNNATTIAGIKLGFKGDSRSRKKYLDDDHKLYHYKTRVGVLFHYITTVLQSESHSKSKSTSTTFKKPISIPSGFTMDVPFNFKFPTDLVDLPSSCDSFGSSANASLEGGYVASGSGHGHGYRLNQSLANITVRYELFLRVYVKTKELVGTGHDVKLIDFLAPLRFQGSFVPKPESELGSELGLDECLSKNVNKTIIEKPDEEVSLDIQYESTSTPDSKTTSHSRSHSHSHSHSHSRVPSPEYPVSPVTMKSTTATNAIATSPMILEQPTLSNFRNNSDTSLTTISTESSTGFSFVSQSTQSLFKIIGFF